MPYLVKVSPPVEQFVNSSLSQEERDRLLACWDELAADPDVDRVSKFYLRRPPWVGRLQHCGGFDTVYLVNEPSGIVEIRGVGPTGFGRSFHP